MMEISAAMRIMLIIVSLLTSAYILYKIRKAKMQIVHAMYWIFFSIAIFLLSLFPDVVYLATKYLQIQSPINFVFLFIIFLLIAFQFSTSCQLSTLDNKLKELVQNAAIESHENKRNKGE